MASIPTTVAFPVIGSPIPNPPFDPPYGAPSLRVRAHAKTPHWLYHLRIRRIEGNSHNNQFPNLQDRALAELVMRLGLDCSFWIERLEYDQHNHELPLDPYIFGYESRVRGKSYQLPTALALLAAKTDRPLPKWVLSTGVVQHPFTDSLELDRTGSIQNKVQLAFGLSNGFRLARVLTKFYQHPKTRFVLGPEECRLGFSPPKLFILPHRLDCFPEDFSFPLSSEEVSLNLDRVLDFEEFDQLEGHIDSLIEDGILVIQVASVWQAAALLGYHHHHSRISERFRPDFWRHVRAFRVRHSSSFGQIVPLEDNFEISVVLAWGRLEHRLSAARDQSIPGRLRVILDQVRQELGCTSGDIIIPSTYPGLLQVIARDCHGYSGLPHLVLSHRGNDVRLLEIEEPYVVEDVSKDTLLPNSIRNYEEGDGPYPDKQRELYLEFLRSIRSYVKLPLRLYDRTVGCMFLHKEQEGPFNPVRLAVASRLASLAAREVERLFREERQARSHTFAPLSGRGSVSALAREIGAEPDETSARRLGQELAELVHEETGAFRVVVRRISADGKRLTTIGYFGDVECGPQPEQAPDFELTEHAAAVFAFQSGMSYIIPDIERAANAAVLWNPKRGPKRLTHASIILRTSGGLLGVLSCDWETANACGPQTQAQLEQLAVRYALALKSVNTDLVANQIEDLCTRASWSGNKVDYGRFLELAAELVGAEEASLVLRDHRTGLFRFEASLQNKDWNRGKFCYEPGEGITGWLAVRNRSVRIRDLSDEDELARLAEPGLPAPEWLNRGYGSDLDLPFGKSFLGIPLSVDGEVVGILRLNSTAAGGFNGYDEQTLNAVASRLAGVLANERLRDLSRAVSKFYSSASALHEPNAQDLAHQLVDLIEDGLGECSIRIVSKTKNDDLPNSFDELVARGKFKETDPNPPIAPTGFIQRVFATGEPFEYSNVTTDSSLVVGEEPTELGSDLPEPRGSGVCVPVHDPENDVVAILYVHRSLPWRVPKRELSFFKDLGLLGSLSGALRPSPDST